MGCFSKDSDKFRWEMPNLELNANGRVALASLMINFHAKPIITKSVLISISIVEKDMYNVDGIVLSLPANIEDVAFHSPYLQFWELDSSRPRSVVFTFDGLDASAVSFVSIVLAFE